MFLHSLRDGITTRMTLMILIVSDGASQTKELVGPVGGRGSDDEGGDIFIPPPAITDEMELVNAPRKIEQIKINYVKTAKTVDVKALKDTLWSGIHSKDKKVGIALN